MKIYYRKGAYKYQLVSSIRIYIPEFSGLATYSARFIELRGGWLTLSPGYACDGPSGPTWDTKSAMPGSFIHDGLTQLIRTGVIPIRYRKIVDDVFYKFLIKSGMWKWRAKTWYFFVREFGESHATKKPRKIYEAP